MRKATIVLVAVMLGVAACQRSSTTVMPVADESVAELRSEQTGQANASAPGEFAFPTDRGGRLLAELLSPSEKSRPQPIAMPSEQRRRGVPATMAEPTLPLPPNQAEPARLSVKHRSRVQQPAPPPEDQPLASQRGQPSLPEVIVLPAGERVRVSSTTVSEPPALPILALPVVDRASLDDPTAEVSQAIALSAPPPDRGAPAPVVRQAVPDPFENRQANKSPRLPPEDATPVTATPKPPR